MDNPVAAAGTADGRSDRLCGGVRIVGPVLQRRQRRVAAGEEVAEPPDRGRLEPVDDRPLRDQVLDYDTTLAVHARGLRLGETEVRVLDRKSVV
mgnify:CR=1 FL=1